MRGFTLLLVAGLMTTTFAQVGGGTDSKLKGMNPEAMKWLQAQMETMEEWWCVDQRMLGKAKLCDHYGKTDNLKEEGDIRSMMSPDRRELNAMHEAYCATFSAEERKKKGPCIMWDNKNA